MHDKYIYLKRNKYFVLEPEAKIKKRKLEYFEKYEFNKNIEFKNKIYGRINKEMIIKALANTLQITFEVTENCNLECKYCGYGNFYKGKTSIRNRRNLSIEYAKMFLDYMNVLWKSNFNFSYKKNVFISFYGGEPLLNTAFIIEIIQYVNNFNTIVPKFSMTTNALLLKKNIDILVKNKIHLLISLDGNKENNSYRIHKNQKESFNEVIENIDFVNNNFPEYFNEFIQFNSVLHNKNSVNKAFTYIFEKYKKTTTISELNTTGIEPSIKEEFWNTYVNLFENLNQSKDYKFIREKLFLNSPDINSTSKFLHQYTNNVYKTYLDFFKDAKAGIFLPTGTCIPFSRKVFITANGEIIQCEKISNTLPFGNITKEGVEIYFDKIIKKTNDTYDKLKEYCINCNRANNCNQCIFNLEINNSKIICNGYSPLKKSENSFDNFINPLLKERKLYKKILKKVYYE